VICDVLYTVMYFDVELIVIYATADEAVAYMFYRRFFVFFLFFFSVQQNYETTVLGNG